MQKDASQFDVLVAGHICLDIMPRIDTAPRAGEPIVRPGSLTQVGAAMTSTGGAVSNTGLALHRLGVPVRLVGKVGDDLFGREVLRILRDEDESLAAGMKISPGTTTSYSIVVSAPGVDRAFLHCPGANDDFVSADVVPEDLDRAKIFHFGYPPIMRRMFENDGAQLKDLFGQAWTFGATTSLDLCGMDKNSAAGRVEWRLLLRRVLPTVSLFLPSIDDLRLIFGDVSNEPLSDELLAAGCAVVMIKQGEHGLFVKATADRERFRASGRALQAVKIDEWLGRSTHAPAFAVEVVNTNGAGDCAIAGFHAAILRGESLENAAVAAAAVGACACESADANTVPPWTVIESRIKNGWKR